MLREIGMKKFIKESTKKLYNKIAPTWKQKVWVTSAEFNERIISFAELKGNEKALDVGIGSGELAAVLRLEDVIGVDISEKMIQECRKLHPEYKLYVGDAESLPFKDNTFDFVYCRNFLQNFEDPTRAFQEMHRVTKPSGKIMVIESAVFENERQFVAKIIRVVEPHHPLFPSHERLLDLFKKAGVKNITQKVEKLHKKWLSAWCRSKGASQKQKYQMIEISKNLPKWYREKYEMVIYEDEKEIESTLTFSFLKGYK